MDARPVPAKQEPAFSLGFTVVLILLLVVPFAIRLPLPALEPYPAVLLPAGASKLRVSGGTYSHAAIKLFAVSSDGRETEIPAEELLGPIPVQYLAAIERNRFGQATEQIREFPFRKSILPTIELPRKVPTVQERAEARLWLRERLAGMGLDAVALHVRDERVTRDIESHVVTGVELREEYTIELP